MKESLGDRIDSLLERSNSPDGSKAIVRDLAARLSFIGRELKSNSPGAVSRALAAANVRLDFTEPDASIAEYLFRVGVFDAGEQKAGHTFLDWQQSFHVSMGEKISMPAEYSGGQAGTGDKASKFMTLVAKLDRHWRATVERALDLRPVHREMQAAVYADRGKYIKAFRMLAKVIEEAEEASAEGKGK